MIFSDPIFGVLLRTVAVIGWVVVCIRIGSAVAHHLERRLTFVMMGVISLMAAIGSLASGIGAATRAGALDWAVAPGVLAMIANAGAGALAAGALIVLTHYRPPVRP